MGFSNQGWFPVRGGCLPVQEAVNLQASLPHPTLFLCLQLPQKVFKGQFCGEHSGTETPVPRRVLTVAHAVLSLHKGGSSRLEEGQERPYSDNIPHIELGNS